MGVVNKLSIRAAEFLVRNLPNQAMPINIFGIGGTAASFKALSNNDDYLKAYMHNIGVSVVIDIKATAKGNLKFKFTNLDDETIPFNEMNEYQKKVFNLLNNPNPWQSRFEFWKQREIFKAVFGNSYVYLNYPDFFEGNIMRANTMVNAWSQCMFPEYNRTEIWDVTKIEDLIKAYVFKYGKYIRKFNPATIIHTNDVNINFNPNQLTVGQSRLQSLKEPISNIDMAFESRNVIGKKRGSLGIFSGMMKDATGVLPLTKTDKEEIQKDFESYGTLSTQSQYMFTRFPLTFQKTSMNVDELKLFEEVSADVMLIAHKFGVPEILVKTYIQGATFENQSASIKRLYQDTLIPESEDDESALSNYFQAQANNFKIKYSYDHIGAMQEDEKNAAIVNNQNAAAFEKLFIKGAATLNEWRKAMKLPPLQNGDKTIFAFSEQELSLIGIKSQTQQN